MSAVPTPFMSDADALTQASCLVDAPSVVERLSHVRRQVSEALVQAGFALLYTHQITSAQVGHWTQLHAKALVQEDVQGHVLLTRVIWAVDSRPQAFGASVLWVDACSHELDNQARRHSDDGPHSAVKAFGQTTLLTTASVVPAHAPGQAYAALVERLASAVVWPVQDFVNVLVEEALAP